MSSGAEMKFGDVYEDPEDGERAMWICRDDRSQGARTIIIRESSEPIYAKHFPPGEIDWISDWAIGQPEGPRCLTHPARKP